MIEDRRKHNRIKAPKVQVATYTDLGPLYGKVHDIDPDGMCAKLDVTPLNEEVDVIIRMNKKDLMFRANVIRSERKGEQVFVAMLFDWNRTSVTSKYYLQKYLEQ
jgi:hypothetical protein